MGVRKFQTRRNWSNTLLTVWLIPFVFIVTAILVALTDRLIIVLIAATVMFIGLTISIYRDRGRFAVYHVATNGLELTGGRNKLLVGISEMIDASMIDRVAAREYIRGRTSGETGNLRKRNKAHLAKDMTRYCSVDLGMTTLTFGLGRGMIDRMPQSKNDLVLLRLRSGKDYFLSPINNVELVTVLNKLIRSED